MTHVDDLNSIYSGILVIPEHHLPVNCARILRLILISILAITFLFIPPNPILSSWPAFFVSEDGTHCHSLTNTLIFFFKIHSSTSSPANAIPGQGSFAEIGFHLDAPRPPSSSLASPPTKLTCSFVNNGTLCTDE